MTSVPAADEPDQFQELMERYFALRGMDVPYYTSGRKITEEAQECVEALTLYLQLPTEEAHSWLRDETADLFITAAVAAHTGGFRLTDAVREKTLKDTNRGGQASGAQKPVGPKFAVGDRVWKPEGYHFPGTIVAVFPKLDGQVRVVAEDDRGLLHIFNEDQLEHEE